MNNNHNHNDRYFGDVNIHNKPNITVPVMSSQPEQVSPLTDDLSCLSMMSIPSSYTEDISSRSSRFEAALSCEILLCTDHTDQAETQSSRNNQTNNIVGFSTFG